MKHSGTLEQRSANRHLSPQQFTGVTVPEGDGLTGPLGSYGDPGPAAQYWQNSAVSPDAGSGI